MKLEKPGSMLAHREAHPELTEREAQKQWEKWLAEYQKQERGK